MDIELMLDTQAHEKHSDKGNKLPLKPHSKIAVLSGARMFSPPHAQGQQAQMTHLSIVHEEDRQGPRQRHVNPYAPHSCRA